MRSEASTLSNAEVDTSAIHIFREQLAQVRATFLSIQDALDEAQSSPLALRLHMSSFFSALDSLENHQQRLGEALMQALLSGESAAVAGACLAWDDDDASVHVQSEHFQGSDARHRTPTNGAMSATHRPHPQMD